MPESIPRISVLMSVYNGEPYLSDSIKSILNQTYTDFEFIIINDGSTDDSLEIIRHYSRMDERIRCYTQKNIGLTPSLNRGIMKARGEYLARMDDDDIALSDRFESQVKFLDRNKDVVAVGGQVLLIDQDGNILTDHDSYPVSDERGQMEGIFQTHKEIDNALLNGEWPLLQSACLLRLSAVKEANGYDERYKTNQDHDLFLKLAEIGELHNLSQAVVKYRRHSGQVTNKTSGRDFENILLLKKIRRKAYKRRGISIPQDLQIPELIKTDLKSRLSKSSIWPYLQKTRILLKSESIEINQ